MSLPWGTGLVSLLGSEEAEGKSKITTKGGVVLKVMVLHTVFTWNHGLAPFTKLKLVERPALSPGIRLECHKALIRFFPIYFI